MSLRVEEKQGTFTMNLNATQHFILGDDNHVTNIFYNIIDNAIKYCDKVPDIRISTENKRKRFSLISLKMRQSTSQSEDKLQSL